MPKERNINAYLAGVFVLLALVSLFHTDPDFAGGPAGHAIGIIGTILIGMTLKYPLKKHIFKKQTQDNELRNHIACGLIGPSLVMVHSVHKLSSLIGTLTYLSLFIVVISGIVGWFLYGKVNRSFREQKRDHKLLLKHIENIKRDLNEIRNLPSGNHEKDELHLGEPVAENEYFLSEERSGYLKGIIRALVEVEYNMKFLDKFKLLFSKWIRIHYLLSLLLFFLVAVHSITAVYYGLRWLP